MSRITAIAAIALFHLLADCAGMGASTLAADRSILQSPQPLETPHEVTPGFAEVSDLESAPADSADEPTTADSYWDPGAESQAAIFPIIDQPGPTAFPCGDCDRLIEPECCDVDGHRGWTYEVGVSALRSQAAIADQTAWPDDFGPAGRVAIGYEGASGFGARAQAWGYSMEGDVKSNSPLSNNPYDPYYFYYLVPGAVNRFLYASPYLYSRPIEISAATVYLDFYKSIHSRHGEFALGMGPAFGHLELNFSPSGDGTRYTGGGLSVFGEAYVPLVERNRWELALTGKTRAALLAGHWEVEMFATNTDHGASMSILELSVGPELRCRVASSADRYWFLRTVAEIQQWRSDGLGPFSGDTLGLHGASMSCGMLW